jgi:hypothetical protein
LTPFPAGSACLNCRPVLLLRAAAACWALQSAIKSAASTSLQLLLLLARMLLLSDCLAELSWELEGCCSDVLGLR